MCVRSLLCSPLFALALALSLNDSASAQQKQSLGAQNTWAAAHISQQDQRQIIDALQASAFDEPSSWLTEFRLRQIDQNRQRILIVSAAHDLCGATGNCQLWVFRRSAGHWSSLLPEPCMAEWFRILPTSNRGMPDLLIATHLGDGPPNLNHFRFDGRSYKRRFAQATVTP